MTRNIYHITHINNLSQIIADGVVWSDRRLLTKAEGRTVIGFNHIKQRRLESIRVPCHPGTMVGDYVPFYFCPRSIMLYIIEKRNAELRYMGGQREVVHLVSTIDAAIGAAGNRPWAFSDGNAGAAYANFFSDLEQLDQVIDWKAVAARKWDDPAIKERKQAEFLVHDFFPWSCFHEIGVYDQPIAEQVRATLKGSEHHPAIHVRKKEWYY